LLETWLSQMVEVTGPKSGLMYRWHAELLFGEPRSEVDHALDAVA
jgi:hypothetical protein